MSKRDRPGGIGLDDLQELLQAQEWDAQATGDGIYSTPIRPVSGPEGETPRETRVVELIVQRSSTSSLAQVLLHLESNCRTL